MTARGALGPAAYAAAKQRAVARLGGRVLEIAAGRGNNFGLLPAGVTWVGLEPDRSRAEELEERAGRHGHRATVLVAGAEDVPLPDRSVDGVLGTVALCSVRDQDRVLAEVARVLVPGGRLVLAEHVAAPRGTARRGLQRVAAPWSRLLDHGCDPARDTEDAVRRSALVVDSVGHFELPALGPLTMPYVVIEAHA